MKTSQELMKEIGPQLIAFAQDLIRIKSYTCHEKDSVYRVKEEMEKLNFDQVIIDSIGSVVGIIGNGPMKVYFDGHLDTVIAKPEEWDFDPWCGENYDGYLHGRGSVDMKSSAAASVYGAYLARELGYAEGKTIYVSCSTMEEDYEGVAVKNEFEELNFKPDYAVICEPTHLRISNGHHGRALFEITVKGTSIHASRHQQGDNALYKMMPIIERVKAYGEELVQADGQNGSIACTKIETDAPSINSIPGIAKLTIDRRITPEQTEEVLAAEMNAFCKDIPDTEWKVVDVADKSWTGRDVVMHNMVNAWHTDVSNHMVQSACEAVKGIEREPVIYRRNGCTNGWVTGGYLGVPTIIFGAGDEAGCHIVNETCPVDEILLACEFYALLVKEL